MKRILLTTFLCVVAGLAGAQAIMTTNITLTPNVAIPTGDPSGVMEQFGASGVSGTIENVQVQLDISGGFNGDLYAYLVGPQGQFAVLLNRVGLSGSNPFGYADAGFNITLDDSGANNNIHNYQAGSYSIVGGQLTGPWASDGRAIDPLSAGSAFDSASTGANLLLFDDTDPNGTWTLFIADMESGGGTPNLNSLTLSIMTVPEPSALALFGGGLAALSLIRRSKNRK